MNYSHQQQYQAGPTMQISQGGNRNAMNKPVESDGTREWSSGICGCADGSACCVGFFCPCIQYSKNKKRYEHLEQKGYPDPEHGGGCCTGTCMGHCLLTSFCGVGWVLQIFSRGDTRRRYHIQGGGCGDCCTAFWCNPCSLSQESHEIQLEEQSFQGYGKA